MAGAESRAGGPLTEYPATLSRDAKCVQDPSSFSSPSWLHRLKYLQVPLHLLWRSRARLQRAHWLADSDLGGAHSRRIRRLLLPRRCSACTCARSASVLVHFLYRFVIALIGLCSFAKQRLILDATPFSSPLSQVYSFSLDGTIRKWAWEAGKLLQTYDVGFPIDAWVMVAGDAKAFYVATTSTLLPQCSAIVAYPDAAQSASTRR